MTTRANLTQLVGAEILPGDETDAIKAAVVALAALISGGKLSVDIGSSVVMVDMATVDVNALIAGIANGKTLSDLDATTGAIAAAVIAGIANGKTLDDVVDAVVAGGSNTDILAAMSPDVPDPQAKVTLANDNWNESFTIPADCIRAEIAFDKKAFCMAGVTGSNPEQDGAPYFPNIRYPIPTGAGGTNNRLFVKNADAGQNVTAEVTFYCTE